MSNRSYTRFALIILVLATLACSLLSSYEGEDGNGSDGNPATSTKELPPPRNVTPLPSEEKAAKWALWTNGTRLRGADLHPCWVNDQGECTKYITRQDVQDLRDLGANLINASYQGVYTQQPPYQVNQAALQDLDNLIAWAEDVGIYVVIHFRTGPGRNEAAIHAERGALSDVWTDQAAHDGWVAMWRYTAERYHESPVVVGYNLMVEPHPNTLIDPDFELEPSDAQVQLEGTLLDWNLLAADITTVIREVDSETPLIVSSLNWGSSEWFSVLKPTGDSRTVYSLHAYDPDVYTHQEEGEHNFSYPDEVKDYGETINFNRDWLDENYRPAREFATQHGVPIYVGEFGIMRWVPNGAAFLEDQIGLFEKYGWNYAYYTWRADTDDWDGFNLENGPDPQNHTLDSDNPLLAVFRARWARNADFPGVPTSP